MKKIRYSFMLALAVLFFKGHAQVSLSLNFAPAFPITRYSGEMEFALTGANLKLNKHVDDYLRINIGAGYYSVPFKSLNIGGVQTDVSDVSLTVIPVTLGGQFLFGGLKWKPYISLDVGYVLTMQGEWKDIKATNRNNFMVAPAFGFHYQLSDDFALNVSARNNVIIYQFRDIKDSNEAFQLLAVELGFNYKF
jgi:hypothetical protein